MADDNKIRIEVEFNSKGAKVSVEDLNKVLASVGKTAQKAGQQFSQANNQVTDSLLKQQKAIAQTELLQAKAAKAHLANANSQLKATIALTDAQNRQAVAAAKTAQIQADTGHRAAEAVQKQVQADARLQQTTARTAALQQTAAARTAAMQQRATAAAQTAAAQTAAIQQRAQTQAQTAAARTAALQQTAAAAAQTAAARTAATQQKAAAQTLALQQRTAAQVQLLAARTAAVQQRAQQQQQQGGGLGAIGTGLGIGAAYAGVKSFLGSAGEVEAVQKMVKAVITDAPAAEKMFQRLREAARLPGVGLVESVDAYARLKTSLKDDDFIVGFLKNVGNAIATVGKGKYEFGLVAEQFSQMASNTKIVSQDLRPILNQLPQIREILQKRFGTAMPEELEKKGYRSLQVIRAINEELAKAPRFQGGIQNTLDKLTDTIKLSLVPMAVSIMTILQPSLLKMAAALEKFAVYWKEHAGTIEKVLKAIAVIVAAGIFYKLGTQLQAAALGMRALTGAMATNPIGIITMALGTLILVLIDLHTKMMQVQEDFEKLQVSDKLNNMMNAGATLEQMEKMGYTRQQIQEAMFGKRMPLSVAETGGLTQYEGGDGRDQLRLVKKTDEPEPSDKLSAAAKAYIDAVEKASRAIADARKDQDTVLARETEGAAKLYFQLKALHEQREAEYHALITYEEKGQKYQLQGAAARNIRQGVNKQFEIRAQTLVEVNRREVEEAIKKANKEAYEAQQKYERELYEKRMEYLRAESQERTTRAREAAMNAIDMEKSARLQALDLSPTQTQEDQIQRIQQVASIEIEFAQRVHQVKMQQIADEHAAKLAALAAEQLPFEEQLERSIQLQGQAAMNEVMLAVNTAHEISTIRIDSTIQTNQIIMEENRRLFDSFKDQAGRVFDALLSRSTSVWAALGNAFKSIFLTAFRDIVTSQVAAMFTSMVTGEKVTLGSNLPAKTGLGGFLQKIGLGAIPIFGGKDQAAAAQQEAADTQLDAARMQLAAAGGGAGNMAGFEWMPGVGPVPASLMRSVVGAATTRRAASVAMGAPGSQQMSDWVNANYGVGSIAVGKGAASSGGGGLFGSIAGAAGGGVLGGGMSMMGAAALGGVAAGGAGLWGAYKAGQSSNKVLKGFSPVIGAAAGLLTFGALSAIFPVLLAAGPAGWIAAAAIGATIALIGMFRKTADQKVREKLKQVYGVDVPEKNIRTTIVEIAKQKYGGNLDIAVRSPEVMELMRLYQVSTGKGVSGLARPMYPVSMAQSSQGLYVNPVYSSGVPVSSPYVGTTTAQHGGLVQVTLDQRAVQQVFTEAVTTTVERNPSVIARANTSAVRNGTTRNAQRSALMEPMRAVR